MSSYSKNIARLKSTSRANLQFSSQDRLQAAKQQGLVMEQNARDIADKLENFSGHLKEWKRKDIERKTEEGILEARKVAAEKAKERTIAQVEADQIEEAKRLGIVLEGFADAKAMDDGYQDIKAEILRLEGVSAYPDADRIAKLSPWQQVGYAKEKLRMFNESFPDKLAHEMANNTKPITINGVTLTAAEIRDKNIQSMPFKEGMAQIFAEQIRSAANIDRFSPEMLKLAGTEKAVQDAIDTQLDQARNRYNIDASQNTRAQADLDWGSGEKTSEDLWRYQKTIANTVGEDGKIMGNNKAWDHVFKALAKEGIKDSGNTKLADEYGKKLLPEKLRKQLGKPKGTTFEQAWPGRFSKLRSDIANGYTAAVDQEKKNLKAEVTALGNQLLKDHRDGTPVDKKKLQKYKMLMTMLGIKDDRIENFVTIEDRLTEFDKERIEERIAEQGYITHAQLDEYGAQAAHEFREKADKWEKAHKTEHRVDSKIKAALNESWADAGIKSKEKPVIWEEALYRATQDYERKFDALVAMGYDADMATHLALNATPGSIINKETQEPVPQFEGVVAEIQRTGAGSKYTRDSEEFLENLADAHIRVDKINRGKQQMLNKPDIFEKEIIGGSYGEKQLNIIAQNIKDYGTWKGIYMREDAMKFYYGLARGKRQATAHGILDAQLKLIGQPGLYPQREKIKVVDTEGTQEAADDVVEKAKYKGSAEQYVDLINSKTDFDNPNQESIYNQPFMIPDYLGGTRK